MLDGGAGPHGETSVDALNALLGLGIIAGWIALAMLLPDFDGRDDGDWGGNFEGWRPG
jgi:hypothetical protein